MLSIKFASFAVLVANLKELLLNKHKLFEKLLSFKYFCGYFSYNGSGFKV